MAGCASMERGWNWLPIPARASQNCCAPRRWRSPYEAAPDVALPGEDGPRQTLALPAPCGAVERDRPDSPAAGADRAYLLRYAQRASTPAGGHNRVDRAAGTDRRGPRGPVPRRWLRRDRDTLRDEQPA